MADKIDFSKLTDDQKDIAHKIVAEATSQEIDPNFALAVAWKENHFRHSEDNKTIKSPAGAVGVMQVMPQTASDYNEKLKAKFNPNKLDDNIKLGVSILKDNLATYGNPHDAAIAYNASTEARNKFFKSRKLEDLPPETQDYIKGISVNYPLQSDVSDINTSNLMKEPQEYIPEAQKMMEEESNQEPPSVPKVGMGRTALNYGLDTLGQAVKHPEAAAYGYLSGFAQKHMLEPNPIDVLKANENLAGKGTINVHETGHPLYGGVDEFGRTGRSRQAYNDITSIRSTLSKANRELFDKLIARGITDPDALRKLFEKAQISGATPSGILAPQSEIDAAIKKALEAELGARKEGMFTRAINAAKTPINTYNRFSAKFPRASNLLSALNAEQNVELARERYEKGQYGGAALSGLNALASGAASIPLGVNVPLDVIKGMGGVGQTIGIPAELAYEYFTGNTAEEPSVVKKYIEKSEKKAKGGLTRKH